MIESVNLPLILAAGFMTAASPGPATLAIAGTSMAFGRKTGLALASGVTSGSLILSALAALGLGAIMLANTWAFEVARYMGACYLLYLAYRSARSALKPGDITTQGAKTHSPRMAYAHGLALHLTNPKALFFFGALYSIGVPPDASLSALLIVIAAVGLQSFLIFHVYAFLFSSTRMMAGYKRLRRWFEAAFALAFGAAGLKVLTARIE